MARKITIDIKTTANLAALNSLMGALTRLQGQMRSMATTSNAMNKSITGNTAALRNFNKAVAPIGSNASRAATGIGDLAREAKSADFNNLGADMQAYARAIAALANDSRRFLSALQAQSRAMGQFNNSSRTMRSNTQGMTSSMRQMTSGFASATAPIQRLIGVATQFGRLLGTTIRSAVTAAGQAIRGFATASVSLFTSLMKAVNGTGSVFRTFAGTVTGSLANAQRSIREFYSSGWSMLVAGRMMQNFGQGILGGAMGNMNQYMSYEQGLTRTAISAAQNLDAQGRLVGTPGAGPIAEVIIDPSVIQDLVFSLQRGTETRQPIMQFDAQELAQGLYYYTSAIGMPVTKGNMDQVGDVVGTIMQMAAVTQTGLETATKGVLNAALEFGIDPRDTANADQIQKIAAQMGYLANLSTLEVPDIAETFKMLGPMAHVLSGNEPGAGLNEMFALTYLASEMGLRGGNVGRGVGQALTTLLDPTEKVVALAAKTWGIDASKEAFKAFFLDAEGHLKGGLPGLFEKISMVPPEQQASFLAEMFTTNATRSLIGIQEALEKAGGWDALMEKIAISGKNPMRWLSEAQEATNKTIFASFQNLQNAWFAVQTSIVDSIRDPLMGAFHLFADALWEISDIIASNPWIGQLAAGIATFVGVLTTAIGSVLMFGGSILLLLKAFSGLGAMAHPAMLFFFSMIRALFILIPLITALAIVGTLLFTAWQSDFLGIRSAIEGFVDDFSMAEDVIPILERIGDAIRFTGVAFNEFVVGILAGFGSTAAMGKWLETVFGPILGPFFYSQLLRFSDALEGFRNRIVKLFDSISTGGLVTSLRQGMAAVQGFFEWFFTGAAQTTNVNMMDQLGNRLGIEGLSQHIHELALDTQRAVAQIISIFQSLGQAVRPILSDIRTNLSEIFDKQTLGDAQTFVTNFLKGMAEGFLLAGAAALRFAQLLSMALANVGSLGDRIGDFINDLTGVQLTIENIGRTLGLVLGTILGGMILRSIIPLAGIITSIAGAFALFAGRVLLALAPLVLFIAQMIVSVGWFAIWATAQIAAAAAQAIWTASIFVANAALTVLRVAAIIPAIAALVAWRLAMIASATVMAVLSATMLAYQAAAGFASIATTLMSLSLSGMAAAAWAAVTGLFTLSTPLLAVALGVAAVVAILGTLGFALYEAWQRSEEFRSSVSAIGDALLSGFLPVVTTGIGALVGLFVAIPWGTIFDGIVSGVTMFVQKLSEMSEGLQILGAIAGGAVLAVILGIGISFMVTALQVVAAIALIVGAVYALVAAFQWLDDHFSIVANFSEEFGASFSHMQDIMKLGWDDTFAFILARIELGMTNIRIATIEFVKDILNTLSNVSVKGVNIMPGDNWGTDLFGEAPSIDLHTNMTGPMGDAISPGSGKLKELYDYRAEVQATIADIDARASAASPEIELDLDTEGATKKIGSFADEVGSFFKNINTDQISGVISDALSSVGLEGIDPTNVNVTDLVNVVGAEEFNAEYAEKIKASTGMTIADIVQSDYDRAVKVYDDYERLVNAVGRPLAEQMYAQLGKPIPIDPGDFEDFAGEAVDAIEAETEAMVQAIENMKTQLNDAIKSADLGDVLSGIFGDGAGGITTAGEGLFAVGDKILENIGDKGPWLNMTELMADAAGSGLMLGTDISGQNIHKALAPFLETVAEQTGMEITDIMKGIDKYIVPEEFVPIATGELLEGLNQIPRDMYKKLDTLGVGEFTEFGLDWAELTKYAIGQGLSDQDWNLADYIASSWDIGVDEAEAYLKDHGIDPNAISQDWFDDTQLMIDSMGGQVSVLTEEWWQYLAEHTNNFADKTIQMTRENFDKLPDAVKIGFTNLGYSFVIGAEDSVSSMDYASDLMEQELQNFATIVEGAADSVEMNQFWSRVREDAKDGQQDLEGLIYEDIGNGMIRIRDSVTGVTIEVPAINLSNFQQSVRDLAVALDDLEKLRRRRDEIKTLLEELDVSGSATKAATDAGIIPQEIGRQAQANIEAQAGELEGRLGRIRDTISELKGLTEEPMSVDISAPSEENFATLRSQTETAVKEGFTSGASLGITEAITTLTADTSAFTTFGQNAMESFKAGFGGGAGEMVNTGPTGGLAVAGGPFDSMFKGYATSAVTAFGTQLDTDLQAVWTGLGATGTGNAGGLSSPFDSQFSAYGASAANSLKIAFDAAMAGWSPTLPSVGAGTAGTEDPTTGMPLPAQAGQDIKVTITLDKAQFDTDLSAAIINMQTFDAAVYSPQLTADNTLFVTVMTNINTALDYYESHVNTAKINADNSQAALVINATQTALDNIAKTYTATIAIDDQASGVIDAVSQGLTNLDGRRATTTIVNNTVNNTTNNTTNTSSTTARAGGGIVRPFEALTLVGEEGPEIAALPSGTNVKSTASTMQMLRDAVRSAIAPREGGSSLSSSEFRNARQWIVNTPSGGGQEIRVEIGNLNVTKDVDVDKAYDRINRLTGRKIEMIQRGMGSFESSRTL